MNWKNLLIVLTLSIILTASCSNNQSGSQKQKLPVSEMIAEMIKGYLP